jgi:hypothetical protein
MKVLFEITNQEVIDYLKPFGRDEDIGIEVNRLVEIGVSIMNRVQTSKDIDFVKKECSEMTNKFDKSMSEQMTKFHTLLITSLGDNFNPDGKDSYLKKTADYMRTSLATFSAEVKSSIQSVDSTVKLMLENASSVSTGKVAELNGAVKSASDSFNPDVRSSYLGKLKDALADTEKKMLEQFNLANTKSIAYQWQELMKSESGKNSPLLPLVQSTVDAGVEKMRQEIISLRELIASKEGENAMLVNTAQLKGQLFEEELLEVLEECAEPFGDSVEATGTKSAKGEVDKKGDFLYKFAEGEEIVIEAKDTPVMLKPMLTYLDSAMKNRKCSFSILVAKHTEQMQNQIGVFNFYDNNKLFTTEEFLPYAIRFARLYLSRVRSNVVDGVDSAKIMSLIQGTEVKLKEFTNIKKSLTQMQSSVSSTVEGVSSSLGKIKDSVSELFVAIEEELQPTKPTNKNKEK